MSEAFTAVIKVKGINPYVAVPKRVSDVFGRGTVPVRVKVNGVPARATLVPLRPSGRILYINGQMREGAGVGAGDRVEVRLSRDRRPRVEPVPALLAQALATSSPARRAWEALAPSRRKQYLVYLNHLKTPEALKRNVRRTVDQLLEGATA